MLAKTLSAATAAVAGSEEFYIENVFSTSLYTGNGSTQTITNGINLSGKDGLVWVKGRSAATGHRFVDTVRGATKSLQSHSTSAEATDSTGVTGFSSTGFALGADTNYNDNAATYASWTFRKAAKFFDVVSYTGSGANRTIAHSLGSTPGCIIVKRTDIATDWQVYHRDLLSSQYLVLNSDAIAASGSTRWNSTAPTSTEFSLGTSLTVNASGGTYVAYLFAHNAGGFGATNSDNVITCGSYIGTGTSAGPFVNLGWEPQWIMIKSVNTTVDNWYIYDAMRGILVGTGDRYVIANSIASEISTGNHLNLSARGFQLTSSISVNASSTIYMYIAIRRGPMKTPTDAAKVFALNARTGTGSNATVTGNQVCDAILTKNRASAVDSLFAARPTGTGYLVTSSTAAEVAAGTTILQANPWDEMNGVKVGTTSTITNASATTYINYLFSRASGFFDIVCYTGNATNRTIDHSLNVVPELMIVKGRSAVSSWFVYTAPTGNSGYITLNSAAAFIASSTVFNNTTPSSTFFALGTSASVNANNATYINYLFATCPGVSKVGSYTGTGTTQQIDCGFTAGARFVLIKRTDSTGDWYVWDTARGIISGNDPYLLLNSTAAEVTNTDYIDPLNSGFEISSTAPAAINASGGSFIYLSIA